MPIYRNAWNLFATERETFRMRILRLNNNNTCEYSKYSDGWSLNASLSEWRKNAASREQRDFKRVSRHLQNEMAFEKSAHTPGLHNWVFVICRSPKISLILRSGNKAPLRAVALLPFTIFSLLPLLSEFSFFFFLILSCNFCWRSFKLITNWNCSRCFACFEEN